MDRLRVVSNKLQLDRVKAERLSHNLCEQTWHDVAGRPLYSHLRDYTEHRQSMYCSATWHSCVLAQPRRQVKPLVFCRCLPAQPVGLADTVAEGASGWLRRTLKDMHVEPRS